jgi:formamidopyrimidine-DNA glycosylase
VMQRALAVPARYAGVARTNDQRFDAYDREGAPCRRCRAPIRRVAQGQRSTYFCATCQH